MAARLDYRWHLRKVIPRRLLPQPNAGWLKRLHNRQHCIEC